MAKIKVYVGEYEAFPVYALHDLADPISAKLYNEKYATEIEEDFYQKYLAIVEAYEEMQQSLSELYHTTP